MFLACWYLKVSRLSFGHALQNGIELINTRSSRYNSPDSTLATRSLIAIAVALGALAYTEDVVAWRWEDLVGDGRFSCIARGSHDCRVWFFICVARWSSLLTVSGLSPLDLFPWRSVSDSGFNARSSNEAHGISDHQYRGVRGFEWGRPSTKRPWGASRYRCSCTSTSSSIIAVHNRLSSSCLA